MLQRLCEECGADFEAKTKRAKFCTTACRVRANRRPSKVGRAKSSGAAEVVQLHTAPSSTVDDPEDSLAGQVRRTLSEIDALTTVAGMAALRVARQIDKGEDSGSAVATLSKELSRLMAEARTEVAPKQKDAADDIVGRVQAKFLRLVE